MCSSEAIAYETLFQEKELSEHDSNYGDESEEEQEEEEEPTQDEQVQEWSS